MQSAKLDSLNSGHPLSESIMAVQNEAGYWYLKDIDSDRESAELFVSLKVATMAIDGNCVTWEKGGA